jgi:hypothetical protein
MLFYMFITIKLYILCSYSCLKDDIKEEIKEEMKEAIIKEYNRQREERRNNQMENLDKTYLDCPICLDLVKNPQEC